MSITHDIDFLIQWHLTERCNLRCSHCYQTGSSGDELSLSEVKEVISEIAETFRSWSASYDIAVTPGFNITGGEPFLSEHFFAVLENLRDHGFAVYVLSNGTLICREKARLMARSGVSGVQVSVEGPEHIHDRIRGKGSFAASVRGVQHLLDAGLEVTLNTTLSDINADSFMEMVGLAQSQGVQRLGFSRLVPSGRGRELMKHMLPKERVRDLYERITAADTAGLEIVTGDPVASQMRAALDVGVEGDVPVGGCAAGVSGMTILPDGTLVPCRRLPTPVGNIRKDSLREVWATSETLLKLRDRKSYRGKCGRCSRWATCRGCRAIAYAHSRSTGNPDILADDPQCFLCAG